MASLFREIDGLLRGERTQSDALSRGEVRLPLGTLIVAVIILGAIYGFFMGWYRALGESDEARYAQSISSMAKVPMLFALTLLVTLPSLYVFNALLGCRLSLGNTVRLLVAAIAVSLAVAASFGPILAFFTLSTTSYPFMVLLNVGLLGVAGIVGLWFLLQTLRKLAGSFTDEPLPTEPPGDPAGPRPIVSSEPWRSNRPAGNPMGVFYLWIIIFAIVGAQMGWLLRPFVGHPDAKFQIFRQRNGSVITGLFENLEELARPDDRRRPGP